MDNYVVGGWESFRGKNKLAPSSFYHAEGKIAHIVLSLATNTMLEATQCYLYGRPFKNFQTSMNLGGKNPPTIEIKVANYSPSITSSRRDY